MYHSFHDEMHAQFGKKMYKLSLRGGMTCPNRDGTLGTGGCIFCSASGSGEFAAQSCENIDVQIQNAKKRIAAKAKNAGFIAYFQDFTNTYAPVSVLEPLFTAAITHPEILALSVATRPDCLPDDVLELLSRLAAIKPVWVELGLQTIHPATAAYIRRGYDLSCFDQAVYNLKQRGISVITHMIIGLPGETDEMICKTAAYIGKSGADGIKFHLLHVLKGTDLADDYRNGKFDVLSLNHYISILEECIRRIPPHMTVHRLTGDGSKRELLAPLWSGDKKYVLNTIHKSFSEHHLIQGEHYNTKENGHAFNR